MGFTKIRGTMGLYRDTVYRVYGLGFPKIGGAGTILGPPIVRAVVRGLYCGTPTLGNYQMAQGR